VHELLHLRYASHGRVFKALMNAYVPGSSQFDVAMGQPIDPVQSGFVKSKSGRKRAI
ncbi:MAG TPA: M48 family peptidase, partial [Phycisphaerales bacterium]|nr:M48 family peptidase [Phycisphaerales bacterium]